MIRIKVKYSFLLLTISFLGFSQSPDLTRRDNLVRDYITPSKIVWQQGAIENIESLLIPGNGQADLVGKNLCLLNSSSEQSAAFILDFGKELHGGIQVVTGMSESKEPFNIKVTLGESVSEAMSTCYFDSTTATNDHAMREFYMQLPWLGKIELGNSGFRFARIELLDTGKVLKIKEVNAISIYRDIPYLGSFKSNDERLNQIWQTGAYTVHLNMQDYLWDGIKRDRLVWVGDMHPEVKTIQSVFGYNEVVPKSLDLIQNITELPEWMNGISSYSMWWILIQHEWYKTYGDLAYLQKHEDYIYDLLDVLATKIDDEGREQLDGHRFLDWPTSTNPEAVHAGLQSMMVMTFKAGIDIAKTFDRKDRVKSYNKTFKKLSSHVPDPKGNKSAAALLALSGLMDAKEVNDKWLAENPNNGVSTFYGYYVLQARALAGDFDGAMDVIRAYWGGMLDLGATTFWEDFNLEWAKNAGRIDDIPKAGKDDIHADYGDYCYVGLRHSLCHGWASGPTAWLTEHVLGITIHENGTAVKIKPNLGDLEWVEGSYPTKHGVIKVRHDKQPDGSVKSSVDVPEGITILSN